MPGYGALNDLVNRIDPVEPARALNAWLTENCDLFPKSLALDGKDPGAKGRLGGIVTLCFHAKPGGHAETGNSYTSMCRSGRELSSDLFQSSSCSRLRDLQKSAVPLISGITIEIDSMGTDP